MSPKRHARRDSASDSPTASHRNNANESLARYPVYHDYATMDIDRAMRLLCVNADVAQKLSEAYTRDLFPSKLHFMIESSATSKQYSDIIYWLPHGRAFVFYEQDRLVRELLPRHFNGQHKFSSFQRQLNLYGFLKLTGNHVDKGAYYHELFLRDRPELSKLMLPVRHTETDRSSVRRKLDPHSEPNLYSVAAVAPSHRKPSLQPPMIVALQQTNNGASNSSAVSAAPTTSFNDVVLCLDTAPTAAMASKEAAATASRPTDKTPTECKQSAGDTFQYSVSDPLAASFQTLGAFQSGDDLQPHHVFRETTTSDVVPNVAAGWSLRPSDNAKSHTEPLDAPQTLLKQVGLDKVIDFDECQAHVNDDGSKYSLDLTYECDSLC